MKTYIGSHTVGWGVGTAVCLCLSPPEGGPKSLKNKRLRQRGWFDQIFMNLMMKWITCDMSLNMKCLESAQGKE